MTVARSAPLLLAAATLVGCSGATGTGAGTTLPLSTSMPVAETTHASLPAASVPTASVSSTPPTAAAPVPSSSPPTSTDRPAPSEDQAERDVIEAAIASWTAFNNVLLDPGNDDLLRALALTRTGEALDRAIEIVISLRGEGRKSVTNPDLPAVVTVFPESVSVDLKAGTAQVEYCRLGSNIAVEVDANADGTDRILDDSINSYHERDEFVLTDGDWRKSNGQTVEIFEGVPNCLAE